MKKRLLLITMTSFLMMLSFNVKAASTCSSEREMELSSLANNVNVDYINYEKAMDDGMLEGEEVGTSPAFYIRVYNLSSDLNLKVNLDGSKNYTYVSSTDAADDGVIYLDNSFADSINNYNLTIRSNDSNCQNEVLRTITITLPMFNYFYVNGECEANADFYLCQEFTTTDYSDVKYSTFTSELETYKEEKAKEEAKKSTITYKTFNFVKTYKWFFIAGGIIILGVIITIIIIKKKRSKRLI